MKTARKKRRVTQEEKVDTGPDRTSGDDVQETAVEKEGNTQDDSIITKGKAISEQSKQLGVDEVQRDEDAAMSKITEDKQNLNFAKELRKKKRNADVEIAQAMWSSIDKCSSRLRPRKEVPSFQRVELNENDSERIVGMRIKVYWPVSRKWFVGMIKSFDRDNMLHRIDYDDGDVEELDLKEEKFELEVKPKDGFHIKIEPRSRKGKKDHSDDVVANTSYMQEYGNVQDKAEIGESTKSAEPEEDMGSNPGKEQPADNKNDKDETQAGSAGQKLDLTDVGGSKKHGLLMDKGK